jgi:hypothetical protein
MQPELRLVTGAALGTDQLACAVFQHTPNDGVVRQIELILAAPPDVFVAQASADYLALHPDRDTAEARAHWAKVFMAAHRITCLSADPPDHDRAADMLLRHVDVLVAVWDGMPAEGAGGTPDIITQARQRGLPLLVISPRDGSTIWFLPPPAAGAPAHEPGLAGLEAALAGLLPPPRRQHDIASHEHHKPQLDRGRDRLEVFLGRALPPVNHIGGYNVFKFLLTKEWGKLSQLLRAQRTRFVEFVTNCLLPRRTAVDVREAHWANADWQRFSVATTNDAPHFARAETILRTRFIQADLLAIHDADTYRNRLIAINLMAAAAVVLALLGLILPKSDTVLFWKTVLVFLELILLVSIGWAVWLSRREKIHLRFVEYRVLAEALRQQRNLFTFAAHEAVVAKPGDPWYRWYLAASAREIGLPDVVLDKQRQRNVLNAVLEHEVRNQIRYHTSNADTEGKAQHALHGLGRTLFGVTVGTLLGAFLLFSLTLILHNTLLHSISDMVKPWVGFFAAAAPALGAALTGIAFTADFDTRVRRSEAMIRELRDLEARFDQGISAPNYDDTIELLRRTDAIMSGDAQAFLDLYGRKELNLPG